MLVSLRRKLIEEGTDLNPITGEQLKEYKDGGETALVFHATVGPHQALYVPAGWTYMERVGPKCDQLGIRILLLGPNNAKMLYDVRTQVVQSSEPEGQSFLMLQKAIDTLSLHS